jgi:hypothetical protein
MQQQHESGMTAATISNLRSRSCFPDNFARSIRRHFPSDEGWNFTLAAWEPIALRQVHARN